MYNLGYILGLAVTMENLVQNTLSFFLIKKFGRKIEELLEYSGFYLIIYLRHGIFKVNLTNMS